MEVIGIIKKKAFEIERKQNNILNFSVEKQKKILNQFPQPKDLIERSFFQYKCQMALYGKILAFMLNVLAFPIFAWYYAKLIEAPSLSVKKTDAVFFADGKPRNIIPDCLERQYRSLKVVDEKKSCYTKDDKRYITQLWRRYPLSWLFLLKCLIKIRYYSYEISNKKPKAIIVCNEYSFTSSMLTDYCHYRNVKNINVMHGEKVFFIMDSFFKFDECYVWGKEYINLFKKLRAEECQFIIAVPRAIAFAEMGIVDKKYDYVFYLGAEHGKQLVKIIDTLEEMAKHGNRVAIRPHPRYTDLNELRKLCNKINIQDTDLLSIEQSIMQTKNVISLYSTVLNQAYHNGIDIVLDDVSDINKYKKLEKLEYVMMSVEHKLLSKCIEL